MNIHSIQHRKRLRKLHQYAPAKHHQLHRIADTGPAGTDPNFFNRRHNADFVWIMGSYHHHHIIAISSSHHNRIADTQPVQHHTKRGGDYRGGNYIAK